MSYPARAEGLVNSIRCYHSGPEWTWERWQWRGTPHSPKLQHCGNLTIRLFSVISRTLVGGGSYPSAEKQSVYSTAPANWASRRMWSPPSLLLVSGSLWPGVVAPDKVQSIHQIEQTVCAINVLYFDLRPGPKILFQGDTPEGSDTFQWPVIERDRVGGLRLMIWDKVKVPLCHYSDAPEESNLWTAWQLFPLDDD